MSRRLIVFNYHRICGVSKKVATDFDDGVFGPTAEQFEQQMVWLKNNADILNENELLSVLEKRTKLANPSALVTFDDGYIDNYILAYPILKKNKIPAIFFIPTEHIITRQLGWWDIISYLIKKTKKTAIIFDSLKISLTDKSEAINFFLRKKKTETHEKTRDLVVRLSEACEVPLPGRDIQNDELMTWDHIREVSHNGITIGSHTHSHNVLTTLSIAEQKKELCLSKSILEREIGSMVNSISYPVGNYQHYSKDTQILAEECGYKLGFSFNTGVHYNQEIQPFGIRRVESQGEIEMFAAMTLLPRLFT
jgi:peptidoglycan/xylan/chitin deacetylase (PgdA/CDA1 family)